MCKKLLFHLFGTLAAFVTVTVGSEAIIGGTKAKSYEFAYTVALQEVLNVPSCTGSIIGDQFILTAAHCFFNAHGHFHGLPVYAVVGTSDLRKTEEPSVTVQVKTVYIPAAFVYQHVDTTGDIAVLKLNSTLKLAKSKHLKMLTRPRNQNDSSYTDEDAIVTGYGANEIQIIDDREIFTISEPVLRYATTVGINNIKCQQSYPHTISQKHLCASVKQNPLSADQVEPPSMRRGVCIRDSGAPLVHNGTTVIGILSRGSRQCSDRKKPGLYTRVSHFLTFIHNAMRNKTTKYMRIYEYK